MTEAELFDFFSLKEQILRDLIKCVNMLKGAISFKNRYTDGQKRQMNFSEFRRKSITLKVKTIITMSYIAYTLRSLEASFGKGTAPHQLLIEPVQTMFRNMIRTTLPESQTHPEFESLIVNAYQFTEVIVLPDDIMKWLGFELTEETWYRERKWSIKDGIE